MTFDLLGLNEKILHAINDEGYKVPTPIQQKIIPLILQGKDVFGIAQTGTGKTASYCLPLLDLLQKSRLRARLPRAMILAPTRELAIQIRDSINIYGKYAPYKVAVIIGGESAIDQERMLDKGIDIVIATPGRLLDTLNRGKVMLGATEFLIIDEADRMLDMGFIPDIEKIFTFMIKKHQTLLFSATVSEPIRRLISKFLNNPEEVFIEATSKTADNIEQFKIKVMAAAKSKILHDIITHENVTSAIIFCNRKKDISSLCQFLQTHGHKSGMIHGDMTQGDRSNTLDQFKLGHINFLVASDVAARGLDVDDLPYVLNYDVPNNPEEYIHRIGRTGRAGKSGRAYTFVTESDRRYLAQLQKLLGKEIPLLAPDYITDSDQDMGSAVKPLSPDVSILKKPSRRRRLARNKTSNSDSNQQIADENTSFETVAEIAVSHPKSIIKKPRSANVKVTGFGDEIPAFFNLSWPTVMLADSPIELSADI